MFLVNGIDIVVVICVIILVLLVVFLRFILPRIKAKKVGKRHSESINSNKHKCH